MKAPALSLRLILALNGIDAGVTLVLAALAGPEIEANPAMAFFLKASPFLFLVVKLAMVDLLTVWLASKPGKLAKAGLLLAVCCYSATIFYQLSEITKI